MRVFARTGLLFLFVFPSAFAADLGDKFCQRLWSGQAFGTSLEQTQAWAGVKSLVTEDEAESYLSLNSGNAKFLIQEAVFYVLNQHASSILQQAKTLYNFLAVVRFHLHQRGDRSWDFVCFHGNDGSFGFVGEINKALVIRPTINHPEGELYRGRLSADLIKQLNSHHGKWPADYSTLKKITPENLWD